MKRRKVNLKLDKEKKTHTQCSTSPKRHAVELSVKEHLNASPSLADSTLDLTVTYDYNMPAYVASGPVKSNNEIVQLFTIDESPLRQPKKRLSLPTLPESHDSPTKKKPRRMKGMGTSVSPEDLRRFEELAHQLVECRGPLDLEVQSPGNEVGYDQKLGLHNGSVQHGITEISLSGDEEFEDLFTSEELSTLDCIIRSADKLSPIHIPPLPPPPPLPPSTQPSCLTTHSTCPAPLCGYSAPPSKCLATHPSYSAPPSKCFATPPSYLAPPSKCLATHPSYLAPQLKGYHSDDDDNFWTDAADMLESSPLEEVVSHVKSGTAAHHASCSPVAVVLTDCSNVPLWSSSQPQPCSQEDIAQKRNKALEKLARKRCKQKVA